MNKMKKWGLSLLLAAATAIHSFSLVWAADPVTKQVAIELEADAEEKEGFSPGEEAGYTLILKNKLGSSWIRVKFDLSSYNIDQTFTDSHLNIQKSWVKRGGYYYYTRKAEAYSDYLVADGLRIPEAVSVGEDAHVTVKVYGDAIQYDSITPDFSKEKPWEEKKPDHSTSVTGSSRPSGKEKDNPDTIHIYQSPQESGTVSTGFWELIDEKAHTWKYHDGKGNYAKNGWIYVYNPYSPDGGRYDWFHFDQDGVMTFGWYKADDRIWYYCHGISDGNLGRLIKGWHEDTQDGKRYFLDRKNGIMLSGWQEIDGSTYYFATLEEIPQQTWFWKAFGDTGFGEWVYGLLGYRSYGSLYVNETTPDGHTVDEAGRRKD